ncbi:hypothetical protein ACFWA6_00085 [Streptomyces sp. NPDC060020]|uniref:hypothetical protein n=1 Tax=Streptomyces sp. NPDC060020 TaxID=3347038 RepID=UPI0036808670
MNGMRVDAGGQETRAPFAGADAWIGVRKVTPENSHDEADLIRDDLTVDDLGPAGDGELLLPQGQMSVKAVDSQETAGENGAAHDVAALHYLPRQSQSRATSEVAGHPWTSVADLDIGYRP